MYIYIVYTVYIYISFIWKKIVSFSTFQNTWSKFLSYTCRCAVRPKVSLDGHGRPFVLLQPDRYFKNALKSYQRIWTVNLLNLRLSLTREGTTFYVCPNKKDVKMLLCKVWIYLVSLQNAASCFQISRNQKDMLCLEYKQVRSSEILT